MDLLLPQSLLATWLFVFARLLGWAWIDPLMGRLPWSLRRFVAGPWRVRPLYHHGLPAARQLSLQRSDPAGMGIVLGQPPHFQSVLEFHGIYRDYGFPMAMGLGRVLAICAGYFQKSLQEQIRRRNVGKV